MNSKKLEVVLLKEQVLDTLRTEPLTFRELQNRFNLKKSTVTNFICSLRNFELIAQETKQQQPNRNNRRYYALPDAPSYIAKYKESKDESAYRMARGKSLVNKAKKDPRAAKVVSCNDYHTTSKPTKHTNPRIGSTFGTMEY